VVTRREALAVRRARERLLAGAAEDAATALDRTPSDRPSAAELSERRERSVAALRLLAALTPDQRRALVLQASGYSYAEISTLTGWTYTKVNRCLAAGRAKLRAQGGYRRSDALINGDGDVRGDAACRPAGTP
jgi:DNA-directed RNA polymerase specialized sigma24 family protein